MFDSLTKSTELSLESNDPFKMSPMLNVSDTAKFTTLSILANFLWLSKLKSLWLNSFGEENPLVLEMILELSKISSLTRTSSRTISKSSSDSE